MAYVFDSIDSALNGQQVPNSTQTSVFAPDPGAIPSQTGSNPMNPGANAPVLKTSTDADLNSLSSANANSGLAPTGGQPRQNVRQNANAAVAKNVAQFTGLPGQYQSQIGKINTDLQKEADTYTADATKLGTMGNVDQATLDKAILGDASAGGQVTSRLRQQAPTVGDFKSAANTNIGDLSALNSTAGLSSLLSRNASADYSSGMAGLDSMLLGQNKDFIRERQGLSQTQNLLRDKAADTTGELKAKAQAAANQGYTQGTGLINDYLGQKQAAIDADAARRLADYNKSLGSLDKDAYLKQQREAALDDMMKNATSQGFDQYLGGAALKLDPQLANYYSQASALNDPSQFYSADDAMRFNTIESLLGGTDVAQAGRALGPAQSFDRNAYEAALQAEALRAKGVVDRVRSATIAKKQQAALAAAEAARKGSAPIPMAGTLAIPSDFTAGTLPSDTGPTFVPIPGSGIVSAQDPRLTRRTNVGQLVI
jgi:hypothetical protein